MFESMKPEVKSAERAHVHWTFSTKLKSVAKTIGKKDEIYGS
jgi:hypothetical protein